ncbi:hypothetical protein Glove_1g48 [Diversispora epigaea]|uniref:Uncharacterized protein n=1 Tax=Diversispora epigaea TaxID=1348612 RepID=A0A397JZK2_9GLOM|nr:hypothetical protein Glove_1g48 [Diversispora epigaea]
MMKNTNQNDNNFFKMINRIMSLDKNFKSLKNSPRERSFPIQIGWNLSVKKIDTFFERHDTRGYKFDIDSKGNVFIVEMESDEHAFVVARLQKYFEVPNGGVADDPPIDVAGASAHYKPRGRGFPSAPDVAIFPGLNIIPPPPVPTRARRRRRLPMLRPRRRRTSRHNEIPPVTRTGRPHAQIMCEVAARLYTRQAIPLPNHVTVIGQPGIYFEEWEFGTLDVNGHGTACTGPGLPAYQVNIPIQEVFWNPPIIRGGYIPTIPVGVIGNNFIIDLYRIQQVALRNQSN